jgi:hypothetical protein
VPLATPIVSKPVTELNQPSSIPAVGSGPSMHNGAIVAGVAGGLLGLALLTSIAVFFFLRKRL